MWIKKQHNFSKTSYLVRSKNSHCAIERYVFQPFNVQCPKMVRHTLKTLQHLLQNFESVSDQSGTLCIKGLKSVKSISGWFCFAFFSSHNIWYRFLYFMVAVLVASHLASLTYMNSLSFTPSFIKSFVIKYLG